MFSHPEVLTWQVKFDKSDKSGVRQNKIKRVVCASLGKKILNNFSLQKELLKNHLKWSGKELVCIYAFYQC